MSEPSVLESEVAAKVSTPPKWGSRIIRYVMEGVAVSFWIYVICKLFIFDLDLYVIHRIDPRLSWIAEYKFFIILGALAFLLLITRRLSFLLWALFVIFYPLFLLFWRLPSFVFKQRSWIFAFAVLNSLISFFRSLKLKFIATAVFLIAMLFAINFSNRYLLFISMVSLFSVVIVSYARMAMFVTQLRVFFRFTRS